MKTKNKYLLLIGSMIKKEEKEWEKLQKEINECEGCDETENCVDHEADSRVLEWGIEILDEVKEKITK